MNKKPKRVFEPRQVKWLSTTEDWYPTYPYNRVRAFFTELFTKEDPRMWRVAVWGDDDFGLEFDSINREEVLFLYDLLCDNVTQKELLDLGFIHG